MSYIGSTPTNQNFIAGTDYFNGTGSAVNFTMSRAVNSVNDIEVLVNNVAQIPSGYLVSGTTLTFSVAPSAGTSNVYVRYLSTTNLSLAIPAGTSATFNTVTATSLTATTLAATTLSATGVTTFAAGTAALPAITTTGDTNTGIFFPAADTIAASTGGSERARIDSSGNLLVGTTSALSVASKTQVSSAASIAYFYTSSTGSDGCYVDIAGNNKFFEFRKAGVEKGSISTNGTNTTYATSSDYRLKEDIIPMAGALAKVALLKPCTYKWKVDGSDGQGFIAHELDEVVSGCVTGEKDAVDAEGNPQYQGIDTSFLVATLTAAIQEQQALITALTARITALEAK